MPYCTIDDITPFLVDPLTDNTKPSTTQAEALIADVDATLDLTMSTMGIDVPPTDSNVLSWLKMASRNGALALIETIIYTQTGTNRSDRTSKYQSAFDAAIDQIKKSPSSILGPTRIDYVMPDASDNIVPDADTVLY